MTCQEATDGSRLPLAIRATKALKSALNWQIAMRPGKRKALDKENTADALNDQAEKIQTGIKAKVEHPSQTIKRQFGFIKVRYKGLKKNTAQQ